MRKGIVAQAEFGRPVKVLFQPHRYSRTQQFAAEFADALVAAEAVGLLPVYAASENQPKGVDSGLIVDHMRDKGLERITLLAGPTEIPAWLDAVAEPGSLVLTLGAGDIGRQVPDVCLHLAQRKRT